MPPLACVDVLVVSLLLPLRASWGWLECSAWRLTLSAFAIGLVLST